jgi:hypothetical protein
LGRTCSRIECQRLQDLLDSFGEEMKKMNETSRKCRESVQRYQQKLAEERRMKQQRLAEERKREQQREAERRPEEQERIRQDQEDRRKEEEYRRKKAQQKEADRQADERRRREEQARRDAERREAEAKAQQKKEKEARIPAEKGKKEQEAGTIARVTKTAKDFREGLNEAKSFVKDPVGYVVEKGMESIKDKIVEDTSKGIGLPDNPFRSEEYSRISENAKKLNKTENPFIKGWQDANIKLKNDQDQRVLGVVDTLGNDLRNFGIEAIQKGS